MSTIAEVRIPADEFALEATLAAVPGARFDVERVVAASDDRILPFVWAGADDPARLETALESDPTIENVELLSADEEERLFRMEWTTRVRVLVYILTEGNATILSLSGFDGAWDFRVLFPDRDALSAIYAFCRDRGFTFDLQGLYELSETAQRGHFGLTDDQQAALVAAVDRGYFDVPRSATMDDLAADLDISRQAVSERLRRGHKRLVESALVLGNTSTDPSLLGG